MSDKRVLIAYAALAAVCGLSFVLSLSWRLAFASAQRTYAEERRLHLLDEPLVQAARVRLYADAGVDAACAEIRFHLKAGTPPPSELRGTLGRSAEDVSDSYRVRISNTGDVYTLESTGELVEGELEGRGRVLAEHTVQAKAQVSVDAVEVLEVRSRQK